MTYVHELRLKYGLNVIPGNRCNHWLQSIVKLFLRCHPPAPQLGLAHASTHFIGTQLGVWNALPGGVHAAV